MTDAELHDLCAEFGCFPSDAQNITLKLAIDALRALLSSLSSPASIANSDLGSPPSMTTSAVRLVASPVGSYAIGCHDPASDVDCVVVGNISPVTFWKLMRCKIRFTAGATGPIRLRRFVRDASVQMMELDVLGVKMDIQYCPAGKLLDW